MVSGSIKRLLLDMIARKLNGGRRGHYRQSRPHGFRGHYKQHGHYKHHGHYGHHGHYRRRPW